MDGPDGGLSAVCRADFPQNSFDVDFHRCLGDVKIIGDDLVRPAGCKMSQYFQLTRRQAGRNRGILGISPVSDPYRRILETGWEYSLAGNHVIERLSKAFL